MPTLANLAITHQGNSKLTYEELSLKMKVDLLDIAKYGMPEWYAGIVTKIEPKRVRIHYEGFVETHDEWIKQKDFEWRIRAFSGTAQRGSLQVCLCPVFSFFPSTL